MHLNPYGHDGVHLLVDLLNHRPDTVDDLVHSCRQAGLVVDMPVSERDLAATLELLDAWWQIIDANQEQQRAQLLNRLLAEAATHPRLTDHDGDGWHLHYRDDDVSLEQLARAITAVGAALHLARRGMDRLGRCASPECPSVYADTSRTGRQRYCSTRCANRDAVRRHRDRRSAAHQ